MSTTPRIYLADQGGETLELRGDEYRHLGLSRRLKVGDAFLTFDGSGMDRRWRVEAVDDTSLLGAFIEEFPRASNPRVDLTLAFSLIKGGKSDDVIAACTQMGVNRFIPMICARTVVKLSGERVKERVRRWNEICRQNSGFSLRTNVPTVDEPRELDEILNLNEFDIKLIFFEGERGTGEDIHCTDGASVLALVGPEGGFEDAEVADARDAGFIIASLGPYVLKAEVAAAKAVSLILR